MKITNIQAVRVHFPKPATPPVGRSRSWTAEAEVANPMSRYPEVKRHRSLWLPKTWGEVWCKVTLEDGTWGLGKSDHGRVVAAVIDDHLAPNLIGESVFATERIADKLFRLTKPYGTVGLASYAVSAVDLAVWDALGKLLQKPVYDLLGGPVRDKMMCYATGNDVDWYKELGFKAVKLACPYGPADGIDGIRRNEEFVAAARAILGDDAELMLDCWMAFDVEYTVRLAEALRPYRLKWMEECLVSEDFDAHALLRERLPWQTLATGEHWYTSVPFQWAARHHAVDIVQPDLHWVGGIGACRKVVAIAEAANITTILHAGGNNSFGQHFSFAMPSIPWCEFFVASEPGVPLEQGWRYPGQSLPKDGWITPPDGPGFGVDIPEDWIEPFFG